MGLHRSFFSHELKLQLALVIVGHVDGPAREGKLDAFSFEPVHDFKACLLEPSLVGPVIGRMIPSNNHNVEAPIVEAVKKHPRRKILFNPFVIFEKISDDLNGFFSFFWRCVVCDADIRNPLYVRSEANVFD